MGGKSKFLEIIQSNINKYGYHVTIVKGDIEPRYAYTIGLTSLLKYELIFAGGIYFLEDDLFKIFSAIAEELKKGSDLSNQKISIGSLGTFSVSDVDSSWCKLMMLGVFDYYKIDTVKAIQIIPDSNHYTLDIPNMNKEFNTSANSVWQWLTRKWDYNSPKTSNVVTNIDALMGQEVTEIMRWEEDEWEMFAGAGPDVDKEDLRVVSLGTMIGIDDSLILATKLEIGKGLWRRDHNSDWNNWGKGD